MLLPGQGGSVGMDCGLILSPACAGPPHPTGDPTGPAFANLQTHLDGKDDTQTNNHRDGAFAGGSRHRRGPPSAVGKEQGGDSPREARAKPSGQASTSQARVKEGEEQRCVGISVGDCPGEKAVDREGAGNTVGKVYVAQN